MKKSIKLLSTLVVALFLFTLAPTSTASANSARHKWYGVASSGAIVIDEECPITVENENLTFNIKNLINSAGGKPSSEDDEQALQDFGSTVTAEYTFYNPADYTVNASLAFPFGLYPEYGYYSDPETGETKAYPERFFVTIDGQEIENTIRHTFSFEYLKYNNDADIPMLIDGYVKDDFYRPDLPVKVYTFTLNCDERDDSGAYYVVYRNKKSDNVKVFISGYSYTENKDDYVDYVFNKEKEEITINLAVIGDTQITPTFNFYNRSNLWNINKVSGDVKTVSVESMDFYSYVMQDYKENNGVLQSDWYNAIVHMIKWGYYSSYFKPEYKNFDISKHLMRWCYYNITLQPKQSIVNSVTVPLYPDRDTSYSPAIYTYHYLLSPAKTWKSFKNLNIKIVTPYELVKSDGFNFVKHPTQNEYNLSLSGLPDGELSFVLSTEKEPVNMYKRGCFSSLNQGGLMLSFLLITTACFYVFKNKKK